MPSFTDKLALLITADGKQAVSELKKVGAAAEQSLGKNAQNAGSGFKQVLGGIGSVAPAAGAAVLAFGAVAVKAAVEGQAAHQQLAVAIANAGQSYGSYSGQIDGVVNKMAKLGFENDDVEQSIARLIPATHSVSEAIKLQGLAADIARGRGISLADATKYLVQAEQGRYRSLQQAGILSANQVKGFQSQQDAIDALTKTYQGNAAAYSNTLAGSWAALSAQTHNLAERIGNDLAPTLQKGATLFSGVLSAAEGVGSVIGKANSAFTDFAGYGSLFKTAGDGARYLNDQTKDLTKAQSAYAEAVALQGPNSEEARRASAELAVAQRFAADSTQAVTRAQIEQSDSSYSVLTASQRLSAAVQQLNNDLSSGDSSSYALDLADVKDAAYGAALTELQMAQATGEAQAAADLATGSVISLADAYVILGQSQTQNALQSSDNLAKAASTQYDAHVKTEQALIGVGTALDGMKDKQSGAGSATKNATAEYYNQQQKLEALRDATQAVTDDAYKLGQAQRDAKDALLSVADAQQQLNDTLKGVGSNSTKGRSAADDLLHAKDEQKSASLDLLDAERQLADDRKKRASGGTIQRDEIAINEARIRLRQTTNDLAEAQRQYDGTLHGFPASSDEAKQATKNLQDAQNKLHDATVNLREAQDSVHDSAIAQGRALDDLQGKLDKVNTGGARSQVQSLAQRLGDLQAAGYNLGESIRQEVVAGGGNLADAIKMEIGTLRGFVDANPLLKGAYDSLLANLQKELTDYVMNGPFRPSKTPGTGRSTTRQYAEGGWVDAPVGQAVPAIVHGGEFVLSRKMLATFPTNRSRSNGAQVNLAPVFHVSGVSGNDVILAWKHWIDTNGPRELVNALGL